IIAGGLNAKAVVYPIAEGTSPATRLTNWAVLVKIGDGSAPPPRREDWSRAGNRDELMPHVAVAAGIFPELRRRIDQSPEIDLRDREAR
ncbi:hypothetical protein RMT89_43515, partial [Streptomyces sp. P17]|nr:hypothetical protein [Streptomyces sp. P17]